LVELFNKRNFTCDCGTTRIPTSSPCNLRLHPETNTKGGVHSEAPDADNKYNQNFKNKFCGCELDYDPFMQKGTMFQCLGLGTAETGGCGEDWWHPSCIVGLGSDWLESMGQKKNSKEQKTAGLLESIAEVAESTVEESSNGNTGTTGPATTESEVERAEDEDEDAEAPLPPGFPHEDDFDGFICYKCVESNPWIKRYAGATGFLDPVFKRSTAPSPELGLLAKSEESIASSLSNSLKRKADDNNENSNSSAPQKRWKEENGKAGESEATSIKDSPNISPSACKVQALPAPPAGTFSLFFKSDFRDHICRCANCFSEIAKHPQLLEEEEIYEPPVSESGEEAGGSTVGSGSIYERGESALKNVDRVRAIEGVMAYNHLKEKLKPFFQQFAESGKAIGAEDIKAHFAKMRGDEQAIKEAGEAAKAGNRKEQSGY
jgi:E3 ubiquitin-protein ligase UBR7